MRRQNRKKPRYVLEEEAARRHPLPVNEAALSEESRRSWSLPSVYIDRVFDCIGCGVESIWTSEEQKHQFEVQQDYIWKTRSRCSVCQSEWHALQKRIRTFAAELRTGTLTLDRTRDMLQELQRFAVLNRGRYDRALYHRIIRIRRDMVGRSP